MARDLLRSGEGRFWRGNLHCHSDRTDGLCDPEAVAAAYREAGYRGAFRLADHGHARSADGRLHHDSRYSTQGPRIERLELEGPRLYVSTSPAHAIALGGAGDRWLDGSSVLDENGGLVRSISPPSERRRAWSNPIWP